MTTALQIPHRSARMDMTDHELKMRLRVQWLVAPGHEALRSVADVTIIALHLMIALTAADTARNASMVQSIAPGVLALNDIKARRATGKPLRADSNERAEIFDAMTSATKIYAAMSHSDIRAAAQKVRAAC